MRLLTAFVVLGPTVALTLACSTTPAGTSEFDDPSAQHGTSMLGNPDNIQTFNGKLDGSAGDGSNGNNDDGKACATTSAEAKLQPVDLIVMFDQSGSMGDTTEDPSYDPAKRWIPVKTAMKTFFGDAQSAGMNAALSFFANAQNSCNVVDYQTAEVGLTALPNGIFGTTLDAHSPKGDTPTRAAVQGAIYQAQGNIVAHPNDKTVIVLVTDGEPYGCGINKAAQSNAEVQNVVADVSAVAAQVPLYVIGVGPSVSNLDQIATAGGTTAFHVDVGDPNTTSSQLVTALAAIRGQLGRCDFDIPMPPDGRTLDFDKVNVEVAHAGQPNQTLGYNASCTGGAGWHFDDAAHPQKVLLCQSTCDMVKADAGGKVNVSFACVNRPDVVH